MTTHRKIALDVVTSEDGTRCAEECPSLRPGFTLWRCANFGIANVDDDLRRLTACIEAERAASALLSIAHEQGVQDGVRRRGPR